MAATEYLCLALSGLALVLSALGLITAMRMTRRIPQEPGSRVASGWLGALSLMTWLSGCVSVSALLGPVIESSSLAFLVVVLVNVLAQPILLLMLYAGIRKIVAGLAGGVAYAWRTIPKEELRDCSVEDQRRLSRFCVLQGLTILPIAGVLSVGCLGPLL